MRVDELITNKKVTVCGLKTVWAQENVYIKNHDNTLHPKYYKRKQKNQIINQFDPWCNIKREREREDEIFKHQVKIRQLLKKT